MTLISREFAILFAGAVLTEKTFSIEGPGFSAPAPTIPATLVGQTSAQQTVTVTNNGNASLVFGAGAVTLTGTSAAEYTSDCGSRPAA